MDSSLNVDRFPSIKCSATEKHSHSPQGRSALPTHLLAVFPRGGTVPRDHSTNQGDLHYDLERQLPVKTSKFRPQSRAQLNS